MPKINLSVPHSLEQDVALEKVRGLLDSVKAEHGDRISGLREEWQGNTGKFSFSIMGFPVSGSLVVESSQVNLDGKIPLMAMPFKDKVKNIIMEQAQRILA
jgi:hypothetical protein